jgi:hypothetical protein
MIPNLGVQVRRRGGTRAAGETAVGASEIECIERSVPQLALFVEEMKQIADDTIDARTAIALLVQGIVEVPVDQLPAEIREDAALMLWAVLWKRDMTRLAASEKPRTRAPLRRVRGRLREHAARS